MNYKEKIIAILNDKELSQEQLEHIFSELKETETEDEKIRKNCIHFLELQKTHHAATFEIEECIAWLEKQGLQKHADKVEPKFKVGDWIVDNCGYTWKIKGILNQFYLLEDVEGGESRPTIEWVNKTFHLWTIQDARDGDVLYSIDSKQPFIYKERPQFSQAIGYCCINKFGEFAIWNTSKCVICTDKYIPASKEQCDFLFQKMNEAGYKWDAEKKELKKIEIITPLFNVGDTIIKKHNSDINDFGQFTITDITGGKYWYNDRIICDITEQDEWELYELVDKKFCLE